MTNVNRAVALYAKHMRNINYSFNKRLGTLFKFVDWAFDDKRVILIPLLVTLLSFFLVLLSAAVLDSWVVTRLFFAILHTVILPIHLFIAKCLDVISNEPGSKRSTKGALAPLAKENTSDAASMRTRHVAGLSIFKGHSSANFNDNPCTDDNNPASEFHPL